MTSRRVTLVGIGIAAVILGQKLRTSPLGYTDTPVLPGQKWRVHDLDRPPPRAITPGTESSQEKPGPSPSDPGGPVHGKDPAQGVNQSEAGADVPPSWEF